MNGSISIIEAMEDPALFGPWFPGRSWGAWGTLLKAIYNLPMTNSEIDFFKSVSGGREPPEKRPREVWICAGRRAGKDSVASLIAAHSAALFREHGSLRRGERASVICIAVDREQAKVALAYTKSFFDDVPMLRAMVQRETASGFELANFVDIQIGTNNFRSVRGRPILCAIFDECAFWRDDTSATPDEATYRAIMPALATIPGSMLIGISSPYKRSGLLWRKYRDYFGKNDQEILVIQAPTSFLNPTIPTSIIDAAVAEDPASAASEWLAQFRDDVAGFLDEASLEAAIERSRPLELPPRADLSYRCFVDASAGRHDAFCACVGHREGERIIIDVARGVRPPFDPTEVVLQFAKLAREYRCSQVVGDNFSGEWVAQAFKKSGIDYARSELPKSGLYLEGLPMFTRGMISIPDHAPLIRELRLLERRTSRAGRDQVDHGPNGSDDYANVMFGAMYLLRDRHFVVDDAVYAVSIPKDNYNHPPHSITAGWDDCR
ncbi:hypothetical protein ACVME8_007688 [Bradyrhizobium diazoefficiens]